MIGNQKIGVYFAQAVSAMLPKLRPTKVTSVRSGKITNIVNGKINCNRRGLSLKKHFIGTSNPTFLQSYNNSSALRRPDRKRSVSSWTRSNFASRNASVRLSDKRYMSSENDDEDRPRTKVKRLYLRSPFKWFDVKVKMLLLRSFFDPEFDENEFLQGAKQAVCLVTSFIAKGSFQELTGLMSDKATIDSKELHQNSCNKAKLRITEEEIDNIAISNLDFIYDRKGRKWADILVTCHCIEENFSSAKDGQVQLMGFPSQRIFSFSFVREFSPGVTANWIIDRIAFCKSFSDEL